MSEKKLCPVCGSDELEKVTVRETFHGDMGKRLPIDTTHDRCQVCGSEGDFSNETENVMSKALSVLNAAYIDEALDYFNENKISFAGIERAVGLPQRTLTKWKNRISSPTAAGIALLKYLRIFPWLIDVADNKFDLEISQKIFLARAFNVFVNTFHISDSEISTAGTLNVYAENFYVNPQVNIKVDFNF
jgi:RNA polymerase subunit RPABC4/transcription elongation factor Spt4